VHERRPSLRRRRLSRPPLPPPLDPPSRPGPRLLHRPFPHSPHAPPLATPRGPHPGGREGTEGGQAGGPWDSDISRPTPPPATPPSPPSDAASDGSGEVLATLGRWAGRCVRCSVPRHPQQVTLGRWACASLAEQLPYEGVSVPFLHGVRPGILCAGPVRASRSSAHAEPRGPPARPRPAVPVELSRSPGEAARPSTARPRKGPASPAAMPGRRPPQKWAVRASHLSDEGCPP
jgi:hypothetical protein